MNKLIDVTIKVPYQLGLMKRKVKYFKNKSIYLMILVHPTRLEIYWSKAETKTILDKYFVQDSGVKQKI